MALSNPIKVLLVDDSAIIRGLMAQAIEAYPGLLVAGRAGNGESAIAMAQGLQPDVIVLDIEMPVMDGLTALPELARAAPKAKIIMASTLTARNAAASLQALALGATDYLTKPAARHGGEADFYRELVQKIRVLGGAAPLPAPSPPMPMAAAPAPVRVTPLPAGGKLNPLGLHALAIACSTGGPQALLKLFGQLQGQLLSVPVFITQHMPPCFTTILAEQLAKAAGRDAHEARKGEEVRPGHIYLAPGDYHMVAQRSQDKVYLHVTQEPPEHYCRPSANPMLRSLAQAYGSHLVAVVLTGMGQDGVEGAREVAGKGGSVIAQDEASCVVYGMPRAVVENGLAKAVLPLSGIAEFLAQQFGGQR